MWPRHGTPGAWDLQEGERPQKCHVDCLELLPWGTETQLGGPQVTASGPGPLPGWITWHHDWELLILEQCQNHRRFYLTHRWCVTDTDDDDDDDDDEEKEEEALLSADHGISEDLDIMAIWPATWSLSSLSRPALPPLTRHLRESTDVEILTEACWLLRLSMVDWWMTIGLVDRVWGSCNPITIIKAHPANNAQSAEDDIREPCGANCDSGLMKPQYAELFVFVLHCCTLTLIAPYWSLSATEDALWSLSYISDGRLEGKKMHAKCIQVLHFVPSPPASVALCISLCISVYLSVFLSVHLSAYLSISICLCLSPSLPSLAFSPAPLLCIRSCTSASLLISCPIWTLQDLQASTCKGVDIFHWPHTTSPIYNQIICHNVIWYIHLYIYVYSCVIYCINIPSFFCPPICHCISTRGPMGPMGAVPLKLQAQRLHPGGDRCRGGAPCGATATSRERRGAYARVAHRGKSGHWRWCADRYGVKQWSLWSRDATWSTWSLWMLLGRWDVRLKIAVV